eukprot:gene14528-biopygen11632
MDVEQPEINVVNDEQIQMASASEEYTTILAISPVVKNESDSRKNDELSTKEIMEDFERMKEIFEYHQAKNSGKQGADLYPEGYGTSEKRSLRRYANKYQMEKKLLAEENTLDHWDEYIDPILFSIRTTKSATTKFTPFQLLYGREALRPVEIKDDKEDISDVAIQLPAEETIVKFLTESIVQKTKNEEQAVTNIKKAQESQKKYYRQRKLSKSKEAISFRKGQKVLLYNARKATRKGDKLGKTWTGPYEITDIVGRKHVYLDDKKTKRNISHLKPWIFPEEQLEHGSCNTDNAAVNSHAKSSPEMNREEPSMASEFSEDKKESINLFVENPSHEDALSSSSGEDCHPCTSSWSRLVEKARDDYHVEENSNGSDDEKQQSNEAESKCSTTTSKLLKTTRLSVPAILEDTRVDNEEVVYRTDTSSFIAKSICIDVSSEAEDAVSEPKEKLSNTTYSAKQVTLLIQT